MPMIKIFNIVLCGAICALSLSACSTAKEQLGLTRKAPDEFAVLKRAPLEIPPDYTLRPPQPGAPRPQEAAPNKQAQAALFGADTVAALQEPSAPTSAESALLQQAGSDQALPNIRHVVTQEVDLVDTHEKPVAERLLGWTMGGDDEPAARVVDAKAEAERLKKNAEEGKSVTDGETPTVEK